MACWGHNIQSLVSQQNTYGHKKLHNQILKRLLQNELYLKYNSLQPLYKNKKFENAIINNRYKIFEYINQGNFGLVFKAFDLLNKKIITIKIIDKPLTTEQKIITQYLPLFI